MEYARCSLRIARVHEHEPSVPRTPGRDFVDRGKNGLECICLLLAYKIKYPENFFLLRGNHECASINRIYGFYDECTPRGPLPLPPPHTPPTHPLRQSHPHPIPPHPTAPEQRCPAR